MLEHPEINRITLIWLDRDQRCRAHLHDVSPHINHLECPFAARQGNRFSGLNPHVSNCRLRSATGYFHPNRFPWRASITCLVKGDPLEFHRVVDQEAFLSHFFLFYKKAEIGTVFFGSTVLIEVHSEFIATYSKFQLQWLHRFSEHDGVYLLPL